MLKHHYPQSGVFLEDFTRTLLVETARRFSGLDDGLVHAGGFFDFGNKGENMISLELVQRLGLEFSHFKPSFGSRFLTKLVPCLREGKDHQVPQLENLDASRVRGRLGEVDIRWSGLEEVRQDQCIFFPPRFVVTRHRVMKNLKADIVFCWEEVNRLKLRTKTVGGLLPKHPEADTSTYSPWKQPLACATNFTLKAIPHTTRTNYAKKTEARKENN